MRQEVSEAVLNFVPQNVSETNKKRIMEERGGPPPAMELNVSRTRLAVKSF